MLRTKKKFEFDEKATLNTEERQARSLEYIAHYLELIEGHLAKLANQDASFGQIGQALVALAQAAEKKK